MSRARHRLTRNRQAIVNTPKDDPGTKVGDFDAFFEADTYTRHVAGPIDGGLPYADGHTGTTSDAYEAAIRITDLRDTDDGDFLEIGAANLVGGVSVDVSDGSTDQLNWPFEFNYLGEGFADPWLASQARRAYFYCDLNNYGPPLQSGDVITNAVMVLTVNGSFGFDSSEWKGTNYRDEFGNDTGIDIPYPPTYRARDYCAYKVLQGITPGNFDKINWWGFTGGDSPAAYWDQPGASSIGVDIDNLGTDHCVTWYIPEPVVIQGDYGGGGPGQGSDDDISPFRLGSGQGYRQMRINITDFVQDAIDNESGVLKVAVHRELDTSLAKEVSRGIKGSSPGVDTDLFYYYNMTNLVRVFSVDWPYDPDIPELRYLRPRIEVSYIRKV